jgi:hypothetical protein
VLSLPFITARPAARVDCSAASALAALKPVRARTKRNVTRLTK